MRSARRNEDQERVRRQRGPPCHHREPREQDQKTGSERNYLLGYRHGITEDDFERMLARQGGLCAICRAVSGAFVDHGHATVPVRGILCVNRSKPAKSHQMHHSPCRAMSRKPRSKVVRTAGS
ncbi:endonuclease domain-containing protein [Nonomuraea angiospora]|uniref:endonuclease domain-containing protein n=1 Tax=Nonomuraea angiospora TaxID=46172 RepID=UPI0038D36C5A